MRLQITVTVPDEWRDETSPAGIIDQAHQDVVDSLVSLGAEDIDTEEVFE